MGLKFSNTTGWIAIELVIGGSKDVIRNVIKILNDKKLSANVDKHSKTSYDIIINSKRQCILQIHKKDGEKYVHIGFHNRAKNKSVTTLEELKSILETWANDFELNNKNNKVPLRKGRYSIQDVLSKRNHLPRFEDDVDFDGDLVHMSSLRYHTFAEKGVECACCGIEGQYFTKDYANGRYHFNLYGVDKSGSEILITKDHVLPRSKGGKDEIENMQTMCIKCNMEKADNI